MTYHQPQVCYLSGRKKTNTWQVREPIQISLAVCHSSTRRPSVSERRGQEYIHSLQETQMALRSRLFSPAVDNSNRYFSGWKINSFIAVMLFSLSNMQRTNIQNEGCQHFSARKPGNHWSLPLIWNISFYKLGSKTYHQSKYFNHKCKDRTNLCRTQIMVR